MHHSKLTTPPRAATLTIALSLAACFLSPFAVAQDVKPSAVSAKPSSSLAARKRAVALMNTGKFAEALQGLKAIQADFPADQDIRFLIGQCALEANQPAEAIRQFEAMLAADANLPRVRLELARAYTAQRDFSRAREQFTLVMASNPPPTVGDNVQKFLDMIDAQRPWSARISLAFVHDSNVNTGPGNNSVLAGGLSGVGITGRSDTAWNILASANHVYSVDSAFAWQTDASVNHLDYEDENPSDLLMLSISSGPTWRLGKTIVSVPLVYDNINVGHDAYSWSFGLAPQARFEWDQDIQINGGFSVAKRKHDPLAAQPRDGEVYGLNAGARFKLGDAGFLQPAIRLGQEQTEQDYFDNRSAGFSLGYILPLPQSMTLFMQPSVSWTRYGAVDPFNNPGGVPLCSGCDSVRRDLQYQFTANLSKTYGKTGLGTALGYTYTRNDSNVGLSDYTRHMVTAMVTWIY